MISEEDSASRENGVQTNEDKLRFLIQNLNVFMTTFIVDDNNTNMNEEDFIGCRVYLFDGSLYECKIHKSDKLMKVILSTLIYFNEINAFKPCFDVFPLTAFNTNGKEINLFDGNESIDTIIKQKEISVPHLTIRFSCVPTIFVWKPSARNKGLGHISLMLSNGTYITHWSKDKRQNWNKQSKDNLILDDDIEAEACNPEIVQKILKFLRYFAFDEKAITEWWNIYDRNYNFISINSPHVVLKALNVGGIWISKSLKRRLRMKIMPRLTPLDVIKHIQLILAKPLNDRLCRIFLFLPESEKDHLDLLKRCIDGYNKVTKHNDRLNLLYKQCANAVQRFKKLQNSFK